MYPVYEREIRQEGELFLKSEVIVLESENDLANGFTALSDLGFEFFTDAWTCAGGAVAFADGGTAGGGRDAAAIPE